MIKIRKLLTVLTILILSVAVGTVSTSPAQADGNYVVGSGWDYFMFYDVGQEVNKGKNWEQWQNSGFAVTPEFLWDVNLFLGGTLTVVDGFVTGDVFEVFDKGVSLGVTSPSAVGNICVNDWDFFNYNPDNCLATNSTRTYLLGAGSHLITIKPTSSPYFSGGAFLRIDPSTSFSGSVGQANCFGKSVANLNTLWGNQTAAATAGSFTNVTSLHGAINSYCGVKIKSSNSKKNSVLKNNSANNRFPSQ